MSDEPISASALRALTGYSQAKRQCDWLEARGWAHVKPARRGDRPKVSSAYYTMMMRGGVVPQVARPIRSKRS